MAFDKTRPARKPTRLGALVFLFKASLLQIRRALRDLFFARDLRRHPLAGKNRVSAKCESKNECVVAESRSALWSAGNAAEQRLQAGKIHNLRLALRWLNGAEIPAGATFSFWKQIGRASRRRDFVRGRELREGCIIPAIGGGLCQLSNALYDAALKAGCCEIIERHAHTQIIPGSLAESGRDATVFWNYVDLRFRSRAPLRIEAKLSAEELIVRFFSSEKISALKMASSPAKPLHTGIAPDCCASCGVDDCFRAMDVSRESNDASDTLRAAFLVDEFWTEFDAFIQKTKTSRDVLALPLDGKRRAKKNYAWSTAGFGKIAEHRLLTMRRAAISRRLGAQGAERQMALLRFDEKLAKAFAMRLSHEFTHVVVAQNLLPFLWRDGHLGGRIFDVLMTRLPIRELHRALDHAASLHPQSATLADFRAPDFLAEIEAEALQAARKIITPHSFLAQLFPNKTVRLDWHLLKVSRARIGGGAIVFPASTLGRKGAYEMREAARQLDLEVVAMGAELEGENFWRGVRMRKSAFNSGASANWLDDAAAVVLPAFVEHKPRRLLEAAAAGVPVIASEECGLRGVKNVSVIRSGDVSALIAAIAQQLERAPLCEAATASSMV